MAFRIAGNYLVAFASFAVLGHPSWLDSIGPLAVRVPGITSRLIRNKTRIIKQTALVVSLQMLPPAPRFLRPTSLSSAVVVAMVAAARWMFSSGHRMGILCSAVVALWRQCLRVLLAGAPCPPLESAHGSLSCGLRWADACPTLTDCDQGRDGWSRYCSWVADGPCACPSAACGLMAEVMGAPSTPLVVLLVSWRTLAPLVVPVFCCCPHRRCRAW